MIAFPPARTSCLRVAAADRGQRRQPGGGIVAWGAVDSVLGGTKNAQAVRIVMELVAYLGADVRGLRARSHRQGDKRTKGEARGDLQGAPQIRRNKFRRITHVIPQQIQLRAARICTDPGGPAGPTDG